MGVRVGDAGARPTTPNWGYARRVFLQHECSAYCRSGRHAQVLQSMTHDLGEAEGKARALLERLGIRFVAFSRAEMPPIVGRARGFAAEKGVFSDKTRPDDAVYLLVYEVPHEVPPCS